MTTKRSKLAGLTLAAVLTLTLGTVGTSMAAEKAKKRNPMQFVYQMYAYDGKSYTENFVPEPEKSFHLIADSNNVVTPKAVDVAWSPSDGEWIADWNNWERPAKDVGAKMEVLKGNEVIKTVEKVDVAMYYPDAYSQERSELLAGKKAVDAYKRFDKETNEYWEASSKHYELQEKYEADKAKGLNPAPLPPKPEQPKYNVSQPAKAFIVNLEPGRYKFRTLDKKGNVIKGSTKDVVAFTSRREGIGYEIKPEPKWTYPVNNDDRAEIIYYVGTSELFFIPNAEKEFNLHNYAKLMKPSSPYTNNAPKDAWTWAHVAKRDGVTLKVYKNGKPYQAIKEKPWIVVQTPGGALGYNIEEWVQGKSKETQPHFRAHQVILKDKGAFSIRYVGPDGKEDPSGFREARPIKEINPGILYAISLLPLILGLTVAGVRAYRTKSQFKSIGG